MAFSVSWVTVYGVHGLPTIMQCRQCSASVVFTCQLGSVYSVQCQFRVCSVQGGYCSVGHSPSVLFGVCIFTVLAVHHESVMLPCSESTLLTAPAQFLSFNIPSTTEGHLRTKYNVKIIILKSTYLLMHDTFWYVFIFRRYSPGEPTRQL